MPNTDGVVPISRIKVSTSLTTVPHKRLTCLAVESPFRSFRWGRETFKIACSGLGFVKVFKAGWLDRPPDEKSTGNGDGHSTVELWVLRVSTLGKPI